MLRRASLIVGLLILPAAAHPADPAAYYEPLDPVHSYYAPAPALPPAPHAFETRCAGAIDRAACIADITHRGSAAIMMGDTKQLLAPVNALEPANLRIFEQHAPRKPVSSADTVSAGTLSTVLGAGANATGLAHELRQPATQRDTANLLETGGGLLGAAVPGTGAASAIGADAYRAMRAPAGSWSRLEHQGRAGAQAFGALAGGAWCSPGGPGAAAECADGGAAAAAYLYDGASAGVDRYSEWRDQREMQAAETRQAAISRDHLARQRAQRIAGQQRAACQAGQQQAQQSLAALQNTGWRQALGSAGSRPETRQAWRTLESLEKMNQWQVNQACQPGNPAAGPNPYTAEFQQQYQQLNQQLPPAYRSTLP